MSGRAAHGLLFVAGFVALAGPAAARTDLDRLAARAERAAAIAERAVTDPSPQDMRAVRAALALPARVRIGDAPVLVRPDPLLAELDGERAADFHVASRHLRGLAAWARAAGRTRPAPDIRADVEQAVAGVEGAETSVTDEVLRRIAEALARLLSGLERQAALGWILLLGLGVLGIWGLTRLGRGVVPEAARRAGAVAGVSAAEWRARADRALGQGDLTVAVAAAYRALVAALAERGLVRDRPSLTAGEVRSVTAETLAAAEVIAAATRRYERVRYGGRSPATDDVLALLEAARRIGR